MKKLFRVFLVAAICALGYENAYTQNFVNNHSFLSGTDEKQNEAISSIRATVKSYASESFFIVTEYKMPSGWHAYYTNPGTVGLPVEVSIDPLDGFKFDGPYLSTPEVFTGDLGVSYGYSHFKVAFRVTPENDLPKNGEFRINAMVQMCRDGECMPPENIKNTIKLDRGNGETVANAVELIKDIPRLNTDVRKELIKSLEITVDHDAVNMFIETMPNVSLEDKKVYFFSSDGEILPAQQQILTKTGESSFVLKMIRNLGKDELYPNKNIKKDAGIPELKELNGILSIDGAGIALDEKVSSPCNMLDLLLIFGGMFLGGLILNVMPCVFPVIGLKILGFVEMGGGERRRILFHSFAFILGVMISFWLLTSILVLLRASFLESGKEISWAIWMQQPWVIFGILLVMLMLGLSMFGVFEIGVRATGIGADLQQKKGLGGSFWSGVLATVVATPCSAPVLGTAISSTLAMPAWGMFMGFTAMGAGLSFPYFVLSLYPGLLKYLPRPGAWMESFKQGVSFIFFIGAGWMVFVYSPFLSRYGDLKMAEMLTGLVIFCSAWWVYGRWCPIYKSKKTRMIGLGVTIILCSLGIYLSAPIKDMGSLFGKGGADSSLPGGDTSSHLARWEEWSEKRQQEALESGHPVYVDFTAKWCLTCLTNKKVAYSESVLQLFNQYGVVLLRADKTMDNPEIDKAMHKLGRSSIPVNVLYMPEDPVPHITSEILTPGYLYDFLEEILKKQAQEK